MTLPPESSWLRAVDEALVTHHLGVAEPTDDYETAKRKLNNLLSHSQSIGEYFALEPPSACPTYETTSGEHLICRRCGQVWHLTAERACVRAAETLRKAKETPHEARF